MVKMSELEDYELISSTSHQHLLLFMEQLLMRKIRKLEEKSLQLNILRR